MKYQLAFAALVSLAVCLHAAPPRWAETQQDLKAEKPLDIFSDCCKSRSVTLRLYRSASSGRLFSAYKWVEFLRLHGMHQCSRTMYNVLVCLIIVLDHLCHTQLGHMQRRNSSTWPLFLILLGKAALSTSPQKSFYVSLSVHACVYNMVAHLI